MKIGVLADRLGMPASTIRYYERIGLLERQRRVAGRRVFDDRALFTLKFIQLAQAAGFTIAEAKSLLEHHAADPSRDGFWQPFAEAKQKAIRQQINELKRMDRVLSALLACECSTLEECVERCSQNPRSKRQQKHSVARR